MLAVNMRVSIRTGTANIDSEYWDVPRTQKEKLSDREVAAVGQAKV
jgi:hypothetical protein